MELKLWLDHYITRKSWSNPLLSSPCTAQVSPGSFVPITGQLDPSRLSTLAVFLRQCLCHYNRSPFFLEASPLQGSGHPPSLSLIGLQRLTHFRHQFTAALPELPFHITNLSYFLSFLRQRASRLKKMLSFSLYVFELWSDRTLALFAVGRCWHFSFARGRGYRNRACAVAKWRGGIGGYRCHHIYCIRIQHDKNGRELAVCKSPPKSHKLPLTLYVTLIYISLCQS